jgi:hypothetical protein
LRLGLPWPAIFLYVHRVSVFPIAFRPAADFWSRRS